MHTDSILSVLRQAYRNVIMGAANREKVHSCYENLRFFLMDGNGEGFIRMYKHMSSVNTDAFDLLIEEAFDLAGVSTFEQFIEYEEE